jgi:hypothetical protein
MNQLPVRRSADKAIRTTIRLRFEEEDADADGSKDFLSVFPHD